MKTIQAQPLTRDGFSDFGDYASLSQPQGYALCGEYHKFYRDQLRFAGSSQCPLCFSALAVRRNDSFTVKGMEYHDYTAEIQMPLDEDGVLVVAPANGGEICGDEAQAFVVPKGTMVVLHPGTWHDVMYPKAEEEVNVLIGLPERTYHNDIVVIALPEPLQVKL